MWTIQRLSLANKTWCPQCGRQNTTKAHTYTIDTIREKARAKELTLLDDHYYGSFTKHTWQCQYGHVFKSKPASILGENGCPQCARMRQSIRQRKPWQDIVSKARTNGLILTTPNQYNDRRTIVHVQCTSNPEHVYDTSVGSITSGHGCRYCEHPSYAYTIEDIDEKVSNFAICLSRHYKNQDTTLMLKCLKEGHIWQTRASNILAGKKCQHCKYKHEAHCKKILEHKTGKLFFKSKPDWMEGLELDGYNDELKLAFEYNGAYHYEPHKLHHRNRSLEEVQNIDDKKQELCQKNGVRLLVIPEMDYDDIEQYINHNL